MTTVHGQGFQGFRRKQLYSTASYKAKNLQGISLEQNDLIGWDFSGQNLILASFWDTDLTRANLTDANLTGADLMYSNLTDADFRGANLKNARVCSMMMAWNRHFLIRQQSTTNGRGSPAALTPKLPD